MPCHAKEMNQQWYHDAHNKNSRPANNPRMLPQQWSDERMHIARLSPANTTSPSPLLVVRK
jgi:hypothetical protein